MCKCKDVDFGSYENQQALSAPDSVVLRMNTPEREVRSEVCVDSCLVDEVKELWRLGIATTGCCCGHNKGDGYIGVEYRFIPDMIKMGYVPITFENDPDRIDTFIPKTIYCPYCDECIAPNNMLDQLIGWHDKNLFVHPKEVHHPNKDLGIFKGEGKFEPTE